MTTELQYRRVVPEDALSLLALFQRVFREDGTGDRGSKTWRWRFEDPPLGNESCVAEIPDGGAIVAHVGGTPHATVWGGDLRRTIECVDHMVAPELRRGLRRSSVFAALKLQWFEQYCGRDRDFLAWGFPSESDFRIGKRFAGYSLLRTVSVLVCQDLAGFEQPTSILLRPGNEFGAGADALWARCQPDVGYGVVRNAAHLSWRYGACPHQNYFLLEARDASDDSLRGLCVLRQGGLSPDVAMVMELLVPTEDVDARHALLRGAAAWAADHQLDALVAWFPECTEEFLYLQELGFRVRPTRMIVAARTWDPSIHLADVRSCFYMSFGDMDAW